MRSLSGLHIENSIAQKRLILNEGWEERLDRYFHYLLFGWMGILPFLVYFNPHRDQTHTGSEYYLLFLATAFAVFVIYRKATEKRLRLIVTDFNKETNRAMLLAYATKKQLTRQRNLMNILVFTEHTSDFNPDYKKSYIFLLKDNAIYFTVIRDRPKLNLPTFTTQYFLRKDLKKLFNS